MKLFSKTLKELSGSIERTSSGTNSSRMTEDQKIINKLKENIKSLHERVDILEHPKLYRLGDSYEGNLIVGVDRKTCVVIPEDHPDHNKTSSYWMSEWEYTLLDTKTEKKFQIYEFNMNPKYVS